MENKEQISTSDAATKMHRQHGNTRTRLIASGDGRYSTKKHSEDFNRAQSAREGGRLGDLCANGSSTTVKEPYTKRKKIKNKDQTAGGGDRNEAEHAAHGKDREREAHEGAWGDQSSSGRLAQA